MHSSYRYSIDNGFVIFTTKIAKVKRLATISAHSLNHVNTWWLIKITPVRECESNFEQWRIQRTHCWGRGLPNRRKAPLGGRWRGVHTPPAGGGPGSFPGHIFENWMQMVHYEPIFFCIIRVDFSSKFLPSTYVQSSDIRDARELTPQL